VPEPVSEDLIVSIPSGRWTKLFGPDAVVGDGAWSRDSVKLALLVKTGPPEANFRLFMLNADGSHRKEIGAVKARAATRRLGWISPRRLVVAYRDAIVIFKEDGTLISRIALPQ